MTPVRHTVALIAALAFALSGCGGGDTDSSSSDKPAAAQPDASDNAPDDNSQDDNTQGDLDPDDVDDVIDGIADGADISHECQFLLKLALAPGLVASGQLDPTTLEGIDVPDELKDDVQVYLDALLSYVDDPVGGAAALSTPEFSEASQHIGEYAEENCPDFGN